MNTADMCMDGTDWIILEVFDRCRYKTTSMFLKISPSFIMTWQLRSVSFILVLTTASLLG